MKLCLAAVSLGAVALGKVVDVRLAQCTAKCESICHQCLQSAAPRDAVSCLDETLLEGCSSELVLTEAWNVTHYCVATDSKVGGWGFMTPVVRDLTPARILSVALEAELVPTTGPFDVVQMAEFGATLGLEADTSTSVQESIIRTCSIENYSGVQVSVSVAPLVIAEACADGTAPDDKMGCEFQGHHISVNVSRPFADPTPIPQSQALFTLLADSKILSNSGILPPALENALFTVTHSVISGHQA
eukprot:Gregarina_sp_Pseudo_9__1377@NODE_1921_length_1249_cov_199_700826_g1781_i0_p1_GENE_NODE_1921_length_1249_cov_199_700826_g1781_i0NODE_1921_length_1249_cov_199_700826_g1781_i0_p1_ORF_typecomplete_len245_score72_76_NODE_1921_length_1249_cov_199_700826_g1781_i0256990